MQMCSHLQPDIRFTYISLAVSSEFPITAWEMLLVHQRQDDCGRNPCYGLQELQICLGIKKTLWLKYCLFPASRGPGSCKIPTNSSNISVIISQSTKMDGCESGAFLIAFVFCMLSGLTAHGS